MKAGPLANSPSLTHIRGTVSGLRFILVLWLAVLWLPASSHVLLERAGVIHPHQPHCHGDHDHDSDAGHSEDAQGHPNESHDAADGRCLRAMLDSGGTLAVPDLLPAFLASAMGLESVILLPDPTVSRPESPGTAPPELAPSWIFLQRTTLPVRAPSSVA